MYNLILFSLRKKEILTCYNMDELMNFENIMLDEIRQSQKDK